MRIISGTARGTKLFTLEGKNTRPTLDRVKESLFNIIKNDICDSVVLDLFSGSGAIGLEFASRGAKKVYLCDNSKDATEIIQKNIEKTHLKDKVCLYNIDFKQMLLRLKDQKVDIIYLDPPYKTKFIYEAIEKILAYNILNQEGIIIAETDEPERLLKEIEILEINIVDQRKYGRAYLFFLKKKQT